MLFYNACLRFVGFPGETGDDGLPGFVGLKGLPGDKGVGIPGSAG